MNWILIAQIAYTLLMILVVLRVLYDTRSSTKALAYILFIVFVPIVGVIFYFPSESITENESYTPKRLFKMNLFENVSRIK